MVTMIFWSCRDPYNPRIDNLTTEIMVVEGFIDGSGPTNIRITRVQSMGDDPTPPFPLNVTGATVVVEDDMGNNYALRETSAGNYTGNYQFGPGAKYRLSIHTASQNTYKSDFVDYKIAPPITDIDYQLKSDGAYFNVSTGDPSGNSKYYKWNWEETWHFSSNLSTRWQYNSADTTVGPLRKQIFDCWQTNFSSNILIGSSAALNRDIINKMEINFIPDGDYRLSDLYSIEVTQQVLDSAAYNYFRQLKQNTEETGSLFDPQPGNLIGNIHNEQNPSELIIGYISAGNTNRLRKFFRVTPWNYRLDCSELATLPNVKDSLVFYFQGRGFWPISGDPEFVQDPESVSSWTGAKNICVDCTMRGTNVKPDFWP